MIKDIGTVKRSRNGICKHDFRGVKCPCYKLPFLRYRTFGQYFKLFKVLAVNIMVCKARFHCKLRLSFFFKDLIKIWKITCFYNTVTPSLTHYPYWFTYPYFKSTDKWVDLGISNWDSTIRTSTVTGTPLQWFTISTDLLIRIKKVRISESTSVTVVRIVGPNRIQYIKSMK